MKIGAAAVDPDKEGATGGGGGGAGPGGAGPDGATGGGDVPAVPDLPVGSSVDAVALMSFDSAVDARARLRVRLRIEEFRFP